MLQRLLFLGKKIKISFPCDSSSACQLFFFSIWFEKHFEFLLEDQNDHYNGRGKRLRTDMEIEVDAN